MSPRTPVHSKPKTSESNPASPPAADLKGVVLVVDDERNIRRTLRMVLEGEGVTVREAPSGEDALAMLQGPSRDEIDVLLIDVRLPNMSGIDVLGQIKGDDARPPLPVILISGHASMSDAVRATRLGAFDFFEKPLVRDRILVSVRNALRQAKTDGELRRLRSEVYGEIVAHSEPMVALLAQVRRAAPTHARMLITGESGTGKELIARAVHAASPRSSHAFVKVNCAAIPSELIETELFGHERGAFTGASSQKKGLFEIADGGTILLDEIGDMDPDVQAKVLRVLEDGEMMRVGGQTAIKVDVRVLAATHRNLADLAQEGIFREDLFFRLNVVPLRVPALRERPGDIPLLTRHFIAEICRAYGMSGREIDAAALEALQRHHWPGNVRELRNILERMIVLSDGDLGIDEIPNEIRVDATPDESPVNADRLTLLLQGKDRAPLKAARDAFERLYIIEQLNANAWNVSRTAEILGLERSNLHRKIKLLQIRRGDA